jgi:hypothetical protein
LQDPAEASRLADHRSATALGWLVANHLVVSHADGGSHVDEAAYHRRASAELASRGTSTPARRRNRSKLTQRAGALAGVTSPTHLSSPMAASVYDGRGFTRLFRDPLITAPA